jgi:hypothetical protein
MKAFDKMVLRTYGSKREEIKRKLKKWVMNSYSSSDVNGIRIKSSTMQ